MKTRKSQRFSIRPRDPLAMGEYLKPDLEHVFDVEVEVEEPIEIGETGDGIRRIIPIADGRISGDIEGHILPGGADYQLFRVDRPSELVAHYAFETDEGHRVYVNNRGIRHASPEIKERLGAGEEVDQDAIYFQSSPTFEVSDPSLSWLTEHVFIAAGERQPFGVKLAVFKVV